MDLRRALRPSSGGPPRRDGEDGLDLFSRRRSTIPIASPGSGPINPDRLSLGSAKTGRAGIDDLLDADIGKHDYDWLLTPPGTPLFPSSDASKHQVPTTAPRKSSTTRSVSTARASRLSASQTESVPPARPARSSSVSRPSISSTYSSYFSHNNRTSLLNTSSASVTSRPTTPASRSTSQSTTRPSAANNSVRSHPSTPTKTRPAPSSPGDKTRPMANSRPSTPNSRPSSSSNSSLNSSVVRSTSRPSTPSRPVPAPAPAPVTGRSVSVGRTATANGRIPGSALRPSSPGPRPRAPVRPISLPDFSHDVPPNLRTKLPERPLSAGRSRPGAALIARSNSNSETPIPASSNRRQSLPIASRNKFPENPPKARLHSNGHEATSPDIQKSASEPGIRRPSKPAATTESTGFGRTISKKSIDMALRHMDIRQSMGGIRGASLFPQSIRPASSKGRPARLSDPVVPVTNNEFIAENGNHNSTVPISREWDGSKKTNGEYMALKPLDREFLVTSTNELDIYGSTRYEAMLLREDSKNMNWLHSVEDKSDQSPVFDHRFEPLPEPFGLL